MLKLEYIESPTSVEEVEIITKPEPLQLVKLPAGFGCNEFWLAETPITEAQWCAVMGETTNKPNYPKVNVSYHDAVEFCTKASMQLGCTVRLPTEFEWCRAVGVEPEKRVLNKYAVFGQECICAVKTKLPNEYGLYDMRGLVWEWMRNAEEVGNLYLRGGSWFDNDAYARAVCRLNLAPGDRDYNIGFRVMVVRS